MSDDQPRKIGRGLFLVTVAGGHIAYRNRAFSVGVAA